MTKAVIFDLEGTLLTTRECRIRAWSQTAREQGIQCDENLLHRMAHARAPQALEIMLTRSHRLYQPAEKLALLARQGDLLEEEIEQHQNELLLPDGLASLQAYQEEGLPVAAISVVSDAESLLRRLKLRNLFDAATGELSAAAKRLHMDCGECLCVSANEETLREAQRLGMKCMPVGADAAQPVFITSKE